jgi:hypothetical protein
LDQLGGQMRKDRRNAKVRFHMPEGRNYLHYKGRKCPLKAGKDDQIDIYRYGDDFFILEYNARLCYIGFELISKKMEPICDMFVQNADEFSEETELKQHILDYDGSYQADILAKWVA